MKNIRCILIDVDGTLTNGNIYIGEKDKEEFKVFNVKDGMGIIKAIKEGLIIGFITGRTSSAVSHRANELNVHYVYQGNNKKVDIINEISKKENISLNDILFIGDDINDYMAMKHVGYCACPNDAANDILEISNYISTKNGGNGAVRDIIEYVLKLQNKWRVNNEYSSYYTK